MRVLIKDSSNFYNGKIGTVQDERVIADIKVYWVTFNDNIGLACRADAVEVLDD